MWLDAFPDVLIGQVGKGMKRVIAVAPSHDLRARRRHDTAST